MMMGGAACCACAYLAFAGFGGPVHQQVHAPPERVYSAFSETFANAEQSGIAEAEPGHPVAYQVLVDKVADKSIDVTWTIEGKEAGRLHLGFEPEGAGGTMITGTIDADTQKIRDTFHGSSGAFPSSSAFAMNAGLSTMLAEAAGKIENGEPLGSFGKRMDVSNGGQVGRPSNSSYADRTRQRAATRPMLDPNADAARYLNRRD
jgi:hypothetical protein